MYFPNLTAVLAQGKRLFNGGPIALLLIEDDVEVASTCAHLAKLGFAHTLAFCAPDLQITLPNSETLHRVDHDVLVDGALAQIVNPLIKANPGTWFAYCYNAEYIYYPFCEDRIVAEVLTFMTEERRKTVMSYVIDLYARELTAHPNGVDHATACFDQSGYYAQARTDDAGDPIPQQFDIAGGLRWRFEEHIPKDRRNTDRVTFFRAQAGLAMLPDRSFNLPDYNTVSCPWHNNLTAAVASFRTAKALRRNPGSRSVINTFHWPQSVQCHWSSQQFLDLGMMEPGQWF